LVKSQAIFPIRAIFQIFSAERLYNQMFWGVQASWTELYPRNNERNLPRRELRLANRRYFAHEVLKRALLLVDWLLNNYQRFQNTQPGTIATRSESNRGGVLE